MDPASTESTLLLFVPIQNFLGNIKLIKKLFDTKINKIIEISVTLKNVFEVNYLMKFLTRGTNFKPSKY